MRQVESVGTDVQRVQFIQSAQQFPGPVAIRDDTNLWRCVSTTLPTVLDSARAAVSLARAKLPANAKNLAIAEQKLLAFETRQGRGSLIPDSL